MRAVPVAPEHPPAPGHAGPPDGRDFPAVGGWPGPDRDAGASRRPARERRRRCPRSEEHTSELQSLMRISYAVFCLKTKKHETTRIRKHKIHSQHTTGSPAKQTNKTDKPT